MNTWTTLKSSFLSGICIGIAGFGYLASPNLAGSVMFTFALIAVVNYRLCLYTGMAGFIGKVEIPRLALILLGNILGCGAMALLARLSLMPLQETAQLILETKRLPMGPVHGGILAIACGFIMTTAVTFARDGKHMPMLFGVPLFITCGFPHCVADAFIYLCVPMDFWAAHWQSIVPFYVCIVLGNFFGCNFYRLVMKQRTPDA